MTSIMSSGVCSMSITPHWKPAWPIASVTSGLAAMIQVPSGAWEPEDFSSWRKGFMVSSFNR
jgi:hypothetical protein